MNIYFVLLAASICAGIPLCGKKCGKVGRIIYCAVFAAAFSAVSALRFRVGNDFALYSEAYESVLSGGSAQTEKGMLLIMKMLCPLFGSSAALFVFTSVVIYFSVFGLIYKNSALPWVSVCAFVCSGVFFDSMGFLNCFIAAVICAYGIKNVCCGSFARFFLLAASASVFYSPAAFMAVMYFLLQIRPTAVYFAVTAVITALFCVFYPQGMAYLSEHYGSIAETLDNTGNTVAPIYAAVFGILFAVCFLFGKRLAKRDPRSTVYLNCMMYTAAFEAMAVRCGIFSRLALLVCLPPLLYLVPELARAIGDYFAEKDSRVLKWLAYGALLTFAFGSFTYFMLFDYSGAVPYTAQFEKRYVYPDEFPSAELNGTDGNVQGNTR